MNKLLEKAERLVKDGRLKEARELAEALARGCPEDPAAHNALGYICKLRGDLEEALWCYIKAGELDSSCHGAFYNAANTLKELGRAGEAVAFYRRAVEADPENVSYHVSFAHALLLNGNFAEGWTEYEWRKKKNPQAHLSGYAAEWSGEPVSGKTVLVYGEQGLGDMIQFARYLPLVKERVGRLIFGCPASLQRLFNSMTCIDAFATEHEIIQEARKADFCEALLSLPRIFKTAENTVPAGIPYIHAEDDLIKVMAQVIASSKGRLNIGIVWHGNRRHENDRNRSCPVEYFLKLADVSGVKLFSLQVEDDGSAASVPAPIIDLSPYLISFAHTAACIMNLDLIISVDTASAHLAGAMGRPVWTILPFNPDWRWLAGRSRSPWYPAMTIFRQSKPGAWEAVFNEVAEALRENKL